MKKEKLKEGEASWGAEVSAAYRAAESDRPESQRVCYDPIVKYFLGARFTIVGKSPRPIKMILSKLLFWYAERLTPGNPGYIVARTRYMDDYLRTSIDKGIEQLVILGAGYDSRAYRFDEIKGRVKVFEVDHPATQKVKIGKVEKAFGSLPDDVIYVAIDFDKESLDERMFQSGYDEKLKTLFIWEGVTMFITAEAVDETLAFIAYRSGKDSSVIFDYILKSVVDGTCVFEDAEKWQRTCKRMGEPYVFGIEEGTICEFLSQRGFHLVKDVDTEFLKRTYIEGIDPERRVPSHYRVVHATVKGNDPA